ncbi:MAG: peptide antibiotic transporter SbmA [Mesorhizobium sp.]|uniref:peptide antibiotic transporter SbmA n=1 Tax=unclassified Mesorhizobium TaxID=325217 RepID=UPI0007ED9F74|nr:MULTISPECIES: peptide antibiotic transporter SbmA [unclassified Mesorhizobium]QIA24844.1 peptide antibiotic transporter SbmA [Mesorhizobium sp. AA22]RUV29951.1 peptide antibiotic transporter SbmA [Mesorhizobium sp. M5C.F.Ca.IN.020.32.2.1]RUV59102.1 peptide antibiotic transporter SbmA [Mesorhizobium sp. M5C.F.Ca.IN.020.29.1.1]RWC43777.1 MAG: peptide antibiotic transporter SbmA [Mesorhizobium sp.]RWE10836.1 MAG: peptide antibiotic transporter SbmA [Mesorhizobium sp.]
MFVSFFPQPKLFFISAVAWSLLLVILWFLGGEHLGTMLGMPPVDPQAPIISPLRFLVPSFLWFYGYFFAGIALFYLFWALYAPHPWQNWSILGSGLVIFVTNFIVQISVALNDWRGMFYDMVQKALTTPGSVTPAELYYGVWQFLSLALVYMSIAVLNVFFVRHYVFRWRTAMNDYFTAYWPRLRHIEGASQRVQDDTMRFSGTMQGLGVNFIDSVMTLIAFLPLLASLSVHVQTLPIVGAIPYPLVIAAIAWSLFGTSLLAVVGIKLPGLEFRNQRVEAALRKELVLGEDDTARAQPPTLAELFRNVRKNYFTLYAHYVYFDMVRYLYLQVDNVFATLILVPTLAIGKITFGIFQQIVTAFSQVASSFQYLVNSWPTIVELISIYKRLRAFEATLEGAPLPEIDQDYLERERAGLRPEDQPVS